MEIKMGLWLAPTPQRTFLRHNNETCEGSWPGREVEMTAKQKFSSRFHTYREGFRTKMMARLLTSTVQGAQATARRAPVRATATTSPPSTTSLSGRR